MATFVIETKIMVENVAKYMIQSYSQGQIIRIEIRYRCLETNFSLFHFFHQMNMMNFIKMWIYTAQEKIL